MCPYDMCFVHYGSQQMYTSRAGSGEADIVFSDISLSVDAETEKLLMRDQCILL